MITKFINFCLDRNIHYEYGRNWCDCVDYTTFVNFWVDGKVHTFYVLDDGSYKLDNIVVTSIEDIERYIYDKI